MDIELDEKLERLQRYLSSLDRCLVAFSGGVDSTLLLKVARDMLGENAFAATVRGVFYPRSEQEDAQRLSDQLGVKLIVVEADPLADPKVRRNPSDRCYHCKKAIFRKLKELAGKLGVPHILDGSNLDDQNDYRPGAKAVKELGVKSPLQELGFTKQEIRELSKRFGLPTWNKPSLACLASRIPYGVELTEERLAMVEQAEEYIRSLGIAQVRVRHHEDVGRIEVADEDRIRVLEQAEAVTAALKAIGYQYVTLNLTGYRSGSMNEILGQGVNS